MVTIQDIINELETIAPLAFQEDYDNSGLLVGNASTTVTKILACLDCTEDIIDEAISKDCNLIIAHHPIIFKGIKKLTGSNYVETTIIKAIKNNISIYAIHTNLDNVLHHGVNTKIAEKLGLTDLQILFPKSHQLGKLITYSPNKDAEEIRQALFMAGAGKIGNYDQCSFSSEGVGTFRGNKNSKPYVGEQDKTHSEPESKIEVIFPLYLKNNIINTLKKVHPYEEVAYDIILLENESMNIGSGIIGKLNQPLNREIFLSFLKINMKLNVIKFTAFDKPIQKIAICGGSGSFLLTQAIKAKADVFITSDFKYHEYFDAENKLMICDIGHFESEQFTPELIIEIIKNKFPNFAPLIAETNTNPINYYY